MYIKRLLYQPLTDALNSFPAIIITGPRQSGKTTFLKKELGNRYKYVTFDDPLQRELATQDPNGFLNQFGAAPLILDEIQYVPNLLSYIKMHIDDDPDIKGRYVMTGSQQFQLMKNISDSLAGRVAILELLPFSLPETAQVASESVQFHLWNGAYPSIIAGKANRELWLSGYLQTYIERDVRQLAQIRNLGLFQMFLGLLAACHSQTVNLAAISRTAGISQPTCREWQSILQASYIITILQPFSSNLGKRLTKSPKIYYLDSAIAAYLTRQPSASALWAGSMGGAFFEGFIVTQAQKVFVSKGLRPALFFWRSSDGLEVDLLIEAQGKIFPVEIKQTATPSLKHGENLAKLQLLMGNDLGDKGTIVCCVNERRMLPGGVTALPWQEFPAWVNTLLA
ncbi:MAG: ATP-binding protein [Chitinivibrionales bacterium]|nr:ATP-binding protein [Chitinivibrionales bacterium]